jgi:hypothetical protein
MKKQAKLKDCVHDKNACIEGDSIYVECRKIPTKWDLMQMSGQHKGSCATIKKNAKAIILKSYTNVER